MGLQLSTRPALRTGPASPTTICLPREITEPGALTLPVVVDNESAILSSVDPAIPKLNEVTHLLGRPPVALTHGAREGHVVFDHLCLACHGLSVLVTARRGTTARTSLFDVGPTATCGWPTPS
jgi:7,8-dihydropterin-6-yl-methyl-4-(beta-D-ribofuranosyl)aminobenzene 5'-phosphate synthase